MAQKSREEGEIGSESREKGDLPPCSPALLQEDLKCEKGSKIVTRNIRRTNQREKFAV